MNKDGGVDQAAPGRVLVGIALAAVFVVSLLLLKSATTARLGREGAGVRSMLGTATEEPDRQWPTRGSNRFLKRSTNLSDWPHSEAKRGNKWLLVDLVQKQVSRFEMRAR